MRMNDILTEDQLDELSMGDIGRGIARGAGKVARGVGSTIGGIKGTASGMKQSYTTARDAAYAAGKSASGPNAKPDSSTSTTGSSAPQQPGSTTAQKPPVSGSPNAALATGQQSTAAKPAAPTTSAKPTSATQLKAPPVTLGALEGIKKTYSMLEPAEREQLKKELEIIDDQDRIASGTNESLKDILKLARF